MTAPTKTDDVQDINEEGTSPESSPENKPEGEAGSAAGNDNHGEDGQGGQQQEDEFKDLPFHEHPRWKQREQEWNERFEKQEQTFRQELAQAITAATTNANKPQAPAVTDELAEGPIPVWFGGGKDTPEVRKMWKEYLKEQAKIIETAEKRAEERILGKLNEGQTSQEKAVADANKHFEASIVKIEATYGKRVDRNELLQYVLDNQIVDPTTQRWDYLKGYRWMMAEKGTPVAPNQGGGTRQDRKNLAGATTKDSSKGQDGSGKTVTTSEDFADPSKRPW